MFFILFISFCANTFLYKKYYLDCSENSTFNKIILKRRYSKPETKKESKPKIVRKYSLDQNDFNDSFQLINDSDEYYNQANYQFLKNSKDILSSRKKKSYLPLPISKKLSKRKNLEELYSYEDLKNIELKQEEENKNIEDLNNLVILEKNHYKDSNLNDIKINNHELNSNLMYENNIHDEESSLIRNVKDEKSNQNTIYDLDNEKTEENLFSQKSEDNTDHENIFDEIFDLSKIDNLIKKLYKEDSCKPYVTEFNNTKNIFFDVNFNDEIQYQQNINDIPISSFKTFHKNDNFLSKKQTSLKPCIMKRTIFSNIEKTNPDVSMDFTKIRKLNRHGSFFDDSVLNNISDEEDLRVNNKSIKCDKNENIYIPTCERIS